MLTAERVRDTLNYDPETGALSWKIRMGSRAMPGKPITCLDSHGYIVLRLDRRLYRAHRIAWLHATGAHPEHDIDHINGQRSDNRLSNLRDVPRSINLQNSNATVTKARAGLCGAVFDRRSGKYLPSIVANGKRVLLGTHKTPESAHLAYMAAKAALHAGATERSLTVLPGVTQPGARS